MADILAVRRERVMQAIHAPTLVPEREGDTRGMLGWSRAFTLVEVTLALGVVAFAIMALLGALPMGILSVRESMQQTVHAHILRQIAADLDLLPLSDLPAYAAKNQYFDYDGIRLAGTNGSIFVAALTQNPADYPGLSHASGAGESLRRVSVDIRRVAEPEHDAFRATVSVFNRAGGP